METVDRVAELEAELSWYRYPAQGDETSGPARKAWLTCVKFARNAALEEAAKVCEDLPSFNPDDPGESYARAVRALKT